MLNQASDNARVWKQKLMAVKHLDYSKKVREVERSKERNAYKCERERERRINRSVREEERKECREENKTKQNKKKPNYKS